MKKLLGLISVLVVLLAVACNKPDDLCEEDKLTAAFVFDYPDTVAVDEPFILNVNYVVENSCGDFGTFEGERYDNTLEVRLKTHYSGCDCTDEYLEKSVSYPVTFDEEGVYELKFWVSENEFDTYVVVAID